MALIEYLRQVSRDLNNESIRIIISVQVLLLNVKDFVDFPLFGGKTLRRFSRWIREALFLIFVD